MATPPAIPHAHSASSIEAIANATGDIGQELSELLSILRYEKFQPDGSSRGTVTRRGDTLPQVTARYQRFMQNMQAWKKRIEAAVASVPLTPLVAKAKAVAAPTPAEPLTPTQLKLAQKRSEVEAAKRDYDQAMKAEVAQENQAITRARLVATYFGLVPSLISLKALYAEKTKTQLVTDDLGFELPAAALAQMAGLSTNVPTANDSVTKDEQGALNPVEPFVPTELWGFGRVEQSDPAWSLLAGRLSGIVTSPNSLIQLDPASARARGANARLVVNGELVRKFAQSAEVRDTSPETLLRLLKYRFADGLMERFDALNLHLSQPRARESVLDSSVQRSLEQSLGLATVSLGKPESDERAQRELMYRQALISAFPSPALPTSFNGPEPATIDPSWATIDAALKSHLSELTARSQELERAGFLFADQALMQGLLEVLPVPPNQISKEVAEELTRQLRAAEVLFFQGELARQIGDLPESLATLIEQDPGARGRLLKKLSSRLARAKLGAVMAGLYDGFSLDPSRRDAVRAYLVKAEAAFAARVPAELVRTWVQGTARAGRDQLKMAREDARAEKTRDLLVAAHEAKQMALGAIDGAKDSSKTPPDPKKVDQTQVEMPILASALRQELGSCTKSSMVQESIQGIVSMKNYPTANRAYQAALAAYAEQAKREPKAASRIQGEIGRLKACAKYFSFTETGDKATPRLGDLPELTQTMKLIYVGEQRNQKLGSSILSIRLGGETDEALYEKLDRCWSPSDPQAEISCAEPLLERAAESEIDNIGSALREVAQAQKLEDLGLIVARSTIIRKAVLDTYPGFYELVQKLMNASISRSSFRSFFESTLHGWNGLMDALIYVFPMQMLAPVLERQSFWLIRRFIGVEEANHDKFSGYFTVSMGTIGVQMAMQYYDKRQAANERDHTQRWFYTSDSASDAYLGYEDLLEADVTAQNAASQFWAGVGQQAMFMLLPTGISLVKSLYKTHVTNRAAMRSKLLSLSHSPDAWDPQTISKHRELVWNEIHPSLSENARIEAETRLKDAETSLLRERSDAIRKHETELRDFDSEIRFINIGAKAAGLGGVNPFDLEALSRLKDHLEAMDTLGQLPPGAFNQYQKAFARIDRYVMSEFERAHISPFGDMDPVRAHELSKMKQLRGFRPAEPHFRLDQQGLSNAYETLGVDRNAAESEIKAAYLEKSRPYLEKLARNEPYDQAEAYEVTQAYKILSDAKLRKLHDEDLASDEGAK